MVQFRQVFVCAAILSLLACGEDPNDPTGGSDDPVEIEYLGYSGAFDSAEFVFHRADGSIVSTQALPTAKAPLLLSERVPRDGMVTLILRRGERLDLETVTGLRPGHKVVLGEYEPEPNDLVGQFELTVDEPAGSNVWIFTPCGLTGGVDYPWKNAIRQNCLDQDDEYSVLLFARSGQLNVAYTYAMDITPNPAGTTSVDLTGTWRTDWQSFRLDIPTLPASMEGATAYVAAAHDGQYIGSFGQQNLVTASNKQEPFSFDVPAGCADQLHLQVGYFEGNSGRYYETRIPFDETSSQHEITGLPPSVSALELDMTTADRPLFQWQADAEAVEADHYLLYVSWEDGRSNPHNWQLHMNPRETNVRIPEIPEAYAEAWSGLPGVPTAELELHSDSIIDGYADFLARYLPGGGFDRTFEPAVYTMSYTDLPDPTELR